MNVIAAQVMTPIVDALNSKEIFVALVGAAHAVETSDCPKVPSVSSLMQVPSLLLFNKNNIINDGDNNKERIVLTSPIPILFKNQKESLFSVGSSILGLFSTEIEKKDRTASVA